MTAAAVFALRCPQCGEELRGLEHDVLFSCGNCRHLVDPATRAVTPAERLEWSEPGTPILWLPMWTFPLRVAVHRGSGDAAAAAAAASAAARLTRLYVAAFALVREEFYGEPGLVWTRRQEPLRLAPRAPGEALWLAGVRRGEVAARRHGEAYALTLVDEAQDVTGLEVAVAVGKPATLLAVPFRDQGERLADGRTGLSYPVTALEDGDGLRRLAGDARSHRG